MLVKYISFAKANKKVLVNHQKLDLRTEESAFAFAGYACSTELRTFSPSTGVQNFDINISVFGDTYHGPMCVSSSASQMAKNNHFKRPEITRSHYFPPQSPFNIPQQNRSVGKTRTDGAIVSNLSTLS